MKRLWADTKRQGGARIQVIHERQSYSPKRTTCIKIRKETTYSMKRTAGCKREETT